MTKPFPIECRELDLHRLVLRYRGARATARELTRLAHALEASGQLTPCLVVPDEGQRAAAGSGAEQGEAERFVLLDGYRRIAALSRLGADTVWVEVWRCELPQALLTALARARDTAPFAPLREATWLRELATRFGLSRHELARRSGRDVSWVSRRLALLEALPDAALEAIERAELSAWAATRIITPLARANPAHAHSLLGTLRKHPLSTRELALWYRHYEHANRTARERLLAHPELFLQALALEREQRASERLRAGPEGECLALIERSEAAIRALRKRLPAACAQTPLPEELAAALARLKRTLERLHQELERYISHDPARDARSGPSPTSPRHPAARDKPPAQALA